MEIINNSQKGNENNQKLLNQSTLFKEAGKLKFRKIQSPEQHSLHSRVIFSPASHRQSDQNIIFVEYFREHKIYQVKDNQIRFVSEHACDFPIDGCNYYEIMSHHFILYIFETKELDKTKKNLKFFEENGLDWEKNVKIIFKFEYGIGVDKVIKPRYLGQFNPEFEGHSGQKLVDIFDKIKPLIGRQLAFLQDKDCHLAEFGPEFENLNRRVFKFKTNFSVLKSYQNKLNRDKSKFDEDLHEKLSFSEPKFQIYNYESDLNLKWKPFIKVDKRMITVGLIDLRSKKILSRKFISIYELSEPFEWLKLAENLFVTVSNVDYSPSVDFFTIDLRFEMETKVGLDPELQPLLDEELKAWRNDPNHRSLVVEKSETENYVQLKKMRFKIFNTLKAEKLFIERTVIGSSIETSSKKHKGKVVIFEYGQNEVKVEILSAKTSPQEDEEELRIDGKIDNLDDQEPPNQFESEIIGGVKRERVVIQRALLTKEAKVFDFRIKSVSVVEETKLLIIFKCKMVLFDMESKKVLSSLFYCKGLPSYSSNTKIQGDLMACCDQNRGYLYFYRIKHQEDGGVNFQLCWEIDVTEFPGIHLIHQFLDFRRLSEDTFIVRLELYFMFSEEVSVSKLGIMSIGFKEISKEDSSGLAILPSHGFRFEADQYQQSYSLRNSYMKGDKAFVTGSFHQLYFLGFRSVPRKDYFRCLFYSTSPDPQNVQEARFISKSHIGEKYCYLCLGRTVAEMQGQVEEGGGMELRVLASKGPPEGNVENKFDIVKSTQIEETSSVYFDEVTDLFRVFYFSRHEDGLKLAILDEELEVKVNLRTTIIEEVEEFEVINDTILYIIGKVERGGVTERKSIIMDLANQSISELVNEDGDTLFGVSYGFENGRLFSFTSSSLSQKKRFTEGIFVSEKIANYKHS